MKYSNKRLFDFLLNANFNELPEKFLEFKKENKWQNYTPIQFKEKIFELTKSLLDKEINGNNPDVDQKAKVGLICFSSPDWLVVDLATQMTGAVLVPLYPNISETEITAIFNETELEICFVDSLELYEKLKSIQQQTPKLKEIYVMDDASPDQINWKQLLQPCTDDVAQEIIKHSEQVASNDVCTIIYTSGTTGWPKGVMLSHKNILSNIEATSNEIFEELQLKENKSLSFLPLNHIYEKMILYTYIYNAFTISFAESIDQVANNLKEVKLYVFCAVPRLLEKVYEKIISAGEAQKGFKRNLFFWAVKLANQFDYDKKFSFSYKLQLWLADALIYKKWRAAIGGNVQTIVIGGGACQERLVRIFGAAKINIIEGYGLTETSPVLAFNRVGAIKPGTVGVPLQSVKIKILEDGEICCQGDNVMVGYYKNPEETSKVIIDGWFHTGDIGEMIDGKYLKITDRKKEMFKTSGGKYVVPQPIENKLKENFLIEQIMIVGDGEKFVSALIVPNFNGLADWCKKHSVSYNGKEEAIKSEEIQAVYQKTIDKYNPQFNHVEQIKKFVLLSNEWTVESGELTPSMKMKRKVILQKYSEEIEKIYNQ
ncbi:MULTISPECIES: AMP-dependent synthetase/ligase [Empedobacter]|uniref:AMP-dependent synthetase/ligase n=1 Tax=Empedobacter TaxID=59734 RepID=UPI002577C175|nr:MULTISPECIES: long-chain fatty acid--CoA ligase [Empedobacter]MDM1040206.1 long-chain fatty acid--CoA ligase [Empedobacter brevis]MDM1134138.1 long-chain fatty acid--CoA ligase [Empedobacter sp. R750]